MRRAVLVSFAVFGSCTRLPDLLFVGEEDGGGLDASVPDAGTVDGGTDAGCVKDQLGESLCADGRDNDCDDLTDCIDPQCSGLICRPSRFTCDPHELCTTGGACPPDVVKTQNETCDDLDACTSGEQCQSDGGCIGGRSTTVIWQCIGGSGIRVLTGQCSAAVCGSSAATGAPMFRLSAVTPPKPVTVFSPKGLADGGCDVDNTWYCGDWYVTNEPQDAGGAYCATNVLNDVWPPNDAQAPVGMIPVYEYRFLDGGVHLFDFSATPLPGTVQDPAGAAFYVCPL